MTHEQDQEHEHGRANARANGGTPSDTRVPGRSSASAALDGPAQPIPSGIVMRKARDNNGIAADAATAVANATSSAASGLPASLQRKFESSLGTDLSGVRVHTDGASQAAASAVGAKAYTVGQDIHFGAGQYDPSGEGGEHLIAHEVAHTVQQRGSSPVRQNMLEVSSPGDAMESEADRAADAMVAGNAAVVSGSTSVLSRAPDDKNEHVELESDTVRPSRSLTPEDEQKLRGVSSALAATKGAYQASAASMRTFGNQWQGKIGSLSATLTDAMNMYETARNNVNIFVNKAAKVAAVRDAVLVEIASAAFGVVLSNIPNIKKGFSETSLKVTEGFAGFNKGFELFEIEVSTSNADAGDFIGEGKGWVDAASHGAGGGDGPGTPSAPGAGAPAWGSELAILQSCSELTALGAKLVGPLTNLAAIGPALGQAEAKVQAMFDATATVGRSIADLEAGAKVLAGALGGIRSAGVAASAALGAIEGAIADAKGSVPSSPREIEKEVWVKWAASLSVTDSDLLDEETIEDRMKALGVWKKLGVDTGTYTTQSDQLRAMVSAKAQERVLEQRGQSFELHGERTIRISQWTVPVTYESGSGVSGHHRATIVGAHASGEVPDKVLEQGNVNTAAEYLIGKGGVTAVLRVVENLEKDEEPDGE